MVLSNHNMRLMGNDEAAGKKYQLEIVTIQLVCAVAGKKGN